MTPTHRDSPLRRSEVGTFRNPAPNILINDDEEERRQARRRTILESATNASSILEDNETLKSCLKIYSENKLSKDNAWSVSLIDTLSTLLQNHHKTLNNFKVAGSSLEASSKVYGLRVDSIHTDVLRMSAGLNKQKITEEALDEDYGVDNNDVNVEDQNKEEPTRPKPKKVRKPVSTITKNKDTINTKLDIVPLTDPIFGKFNTIMGSINSSNRLLQNILPSLNSELLLRLNYKFWDRNPVDDLTQLDITSYEKSKLESCTSLMEIDFSNLRFRPTHTGYIISDTPEKREEDEEREINYNEPPTQNNMADNNDKLHLSVTFDINAESEPVSSKQYCLDVDFGEVEDLTVDERMVLYNCKGLRKSPVIIEDLRPVDSSSNLEYSYRPLDKISQFWAGPSHWKFKKDRSKISLPGQYSVANVRTDNNTRQKGKANRLRLRSKQINFSEQHDDLFQKLDAKSKLRKANIQKKWDAKKFKLPSDMQIDRDIFDNFCFAPALSMKEKLFDLVEAEETNKENYENDVESDEPFRSHTENVYTNDDFQYEDCENQYAAPEHNWNQTVVEIGSQFEGAPDKVTKIVVPFAKRAKIVDMKQLKKCCMTLIKKQFSNNNTNNNDNEPSEFNDEKYISGDATFKELYVNLPKMLTSTMSESLSPSVAFYSILHLANDFNLRILPNDDLNDFKIRQLDI